MNLLLRQIQIYLLIKNRKFTLIHGFKMDYRLLEKKYSNTRDEKLRKNAC